MWTDASSRTSTTKKKEDLICNLFQPSKGNLSASSRVLNWVFMALMLDPITPISGSDGSTVRTPHICRGGQWRCYFSQSCRACCHGQGNGANVSSCLKFKQKLAKHKEVTCNSNRGKLREWEKYFMTNTWHALCLEGGEKKRKKSIGLLISSLTTCVPTRRPSPGCLENTFWIKCFKKAAVFFFLKALLKDYRSIWGLILKANKSQIFPSI